MKYFIAEKNGVKIVVSGEPTGLNEKGKKRPEWDCMWDCKGLWYLNKEDSDKLGKLKRPLIYKKEHILIKDDIAYIVWVN